ncbi:DNA adenine methylase [Nocardioides antri]|nr:DNA adenine methylase [Nocardioides antri]
MSHICEAVDDALQGLRSDAFDALVAEEERLLAGHDDVALCDLVEGGSIASWTWSGGHQSPTDSLGFLLTDAAKALRNSRYAAITEHYGGVYFSYQQAATLDALCVVAHGAASDEKDTILAAILSTASELVASVGGHFAQPVRVRTAAGAVKTNSVAAVRRSRSQQALPVFMRWLSKWSFRQPAAHPAVAVRADFRDVLGNLPLDVGVVYADPPYTRDHYSRFYHVLETIAIGDQPGLTTVRLGGREVPSRGLYRQERHQSPFSIVRSAPLALAQLCGELKQRDLPLVLSYSPIPETEKPRQRVMTMGVLLRVLEETFDHVEVLPIAGISHSKFNARHVNASPAEQAEVLVVCRP